MGMCITTHACYAGDRSVSSNAAFCHANVVVHNCSVDPSMSAAVQHAVYFLHHAVQALQQWHGLQQQWCSAAPLSVSQQLQSAEEAAWLLQRLATQQAVQQLLLDEEIEQLQQESDASIAAAKQQLDDLAAAVKAAAPDAFQSSPDGELVCAALRDV
jgi:hypothetical protein